MNIVISLVIRQEHYEEFCKLGYRREPDAWPWAVLSNQMVVQHAADFVEFPPPALSRLLRVRLPYKGCYVHNSVTNHRIRPEHLIASDGFEAETCCSWGLQPCVVFQEREPEGPSLGADDLANAALFSRFLQDVDMILGFAAPYTAVRA